MHWVWWVVAAVALGVLEILTLDLVLLMLAAGAVAALVASALGGDIVVQVLTFAVTSTVMLVFLRPYLLRNLRRRTPLVETNAAANVGRPALTLSEVTERGGLVKLAGEQWSARTDGAHVVLPAGADVRVVRIDGATAVVAPLPAPDDAAPDDAPPAPPASAP
ncbi:membrane protein [Actinotalea ferrariae CF5-4]|uniref:Membrane protein n=1 Tax=Actinotalea ferrariae CF5-4 TaxID=948458 RepID=A0A021VMN6_9CELL|nr:membrane protein [Actinotalea ferrariae CF5-4]